MKIAHMAAYHVNVGDNITIRHIRRDIESQIENIDWVDVNVTEFHEKRNDLEFSKRKLKSINKSCDALIIGGGGLIEGASYNKFSTNWKLPFNKDILDEFNLPIFCHSLGLNYFWDLPELTDKGQSCFKYLLGKAKCFSVRDDGSLNLVKGITTAACDETPDPGMIFKINDIRPRKHKVKIGAFQPAINANIQINKGRFRNEDNLDLISSFVKTFHLFGMPHTVKDLNFPISRWSRNLGHKQWQTLTHFSRFMNIVRDYKKTDFVVAMRGHGQIITMGMNIPGIYFVTQPKVLGLSKKTNMMPYTVDIRDKNWHEKLIDCTRRLQSDDKYLLDWYNRRDAYLFDAKKKYGEFNLKIAAHLENLK